MVSRFRVRDGTEACPIVEDESYISELEKEVQFFFFFFFWNQYSHTAYTMASLRGYVRQPKGLKTARR